MGNSASTESSSAAGAPAVPEGYFGVRVSGLYCYLLIILFIQYIHSNLHD